MTDPGSRRRREAALAGHRGDEASARALIADPEPGVRATALSALARMGRATDSDVLGVLSSYGKAPGKLEYVHGITMDPADGSLYRVEIKTWRVKKWVRTTR